MFVFSHTDLLSSSILCGSALFWDFQMGRSESPEKCRHMKEAVHLLNTRLQDPEVEISDSTILAVAHLADFEASPSVICDMEE
jgi:hypothetical protein